MLKIDPKAKVSEFADIESSVKGTSIIIGAASHIDSFVKIKPAGGVGDVIIGEGCYINSGCVLYSGNGIRIGRHVLIAANCTLAPVSHEYAERSKLIVEQGFKESRGGIVIEDDVWIGANCVILDDTRLREGCVIGAVSMVNEEVMRYSVQAGNPLQQIGQRS